MYNSWTPRFPLECNSVGRARLCPQPHSQFSLCLSSCAPPPPSHNVIMDIPARLNFGHSPLVQALVLGVCTPAMWATIWRIDSGSKLVHALDTGWGTMPGAWSRKGDCGPQISTSSSTQQLVGIEEFPAPP